MLWQHYDVKLNG